jgi:hypothetical protein
MNVNPKGFWRVDKEKEPELRHPILTLAAFRDLRIMVEQHGGDLDKGIDAFCDQNDGEGWMIPETLCLADFGLGHDDRAKKPQPVRERLGPRFFDWQLEQSSEESWAECEMHARKILGDEHFETMKKELQSPDSPMRHAQSIAVAEGGEIYSGDQPQGELFRRN